MLFAINKSFDRIHDAQKLIGQCLFQRLTFVIVCRDRGDGYLEDHQKSGEQDQLGGKAEIHRCVQPNLHAVRVLRKGFSFGEMRVGWRGEKVEPNNCRWKPAFAACMSARGRKGTARAGVKAGGFRPCPPRIGTGVGEG